METVQKGESMAKTVVLNVKVNDEEVKKLNKELGTTVEEQKSAQKETKALGGLMGKLDKMTGGLITRLGGMKTALTGVSVGFRGVGVAIAASGIGLVILAIAAVTAAFKNTEEGQLKFAKFMGIIGSVTGNLIDVLSSLGDLIIGLFEGDSKAIQTIRKFGNDIKTLLLLPINTLIDGVKGLGNAFVALVSGDVSGAMEAVKNGISDINDNVAEGVGIAKQYTDALKELGKEIARDADIAVGVSRLRELALKKERELIVERAIADRDIADLRDKAVQREKFSAEERIAFLTKASDISNAIITKEIEAAELRREAIKAENQLSGSKTEDLDEEARLTANVIQLDTQRLNLAKRLNAELETTRREGGGSKRKDEKGLDILPQGASGGSDLQDAADLSNSEFLNSEEVFQAKRTQIERDYASVRERIAAEEAQTKLMLLDSVSNGLSAASELAGRETAAGKGLAVAGALINTYASIAGQLKAFAGIPIPGFAIAQAVATGIAGFAAVKNILAVKVPGGGGGSGGGGGTSPTRPPSFNVVGNSPQNQLNQALLEQNKEPVKAYVLEGEVTTAQQARRNKVKDSSI